MEKTIRERLEAIWDKFPCVWPLEICKWHMDEVENLEITNAKDQIRIQRTEDWRY